MVKSYLKGKARLEKAAMEILIENIRCFHGEHRIPLAPVTLLVGENSTGKSTFLAVVAGLANAAGFPFYPGLNTPPYDLGSYENIASRKSAQAKPVRFFRFGFATSDKQQRGTRTSIATYKAHLGQVVLSEFQIDQENGTVQLALEKEQARGQIEIFGKDGSPSSSIVPFDTRFPTTESVRAARGFFPLLLMDHFKATAGRTSPDQPRISDLLDIAASGDFPIQNVISIAPIRTKPSRTYDRFTDEFKPEGDHVPLRLAHVLDAEANESLKQRVVAGLNAFGKESGLFTNVEIRRLGKSTTSPFQVMVHVGGLPQNLLDVGYGVSQCLPIVVQSILGKSNSLLLMQQPEVHLHPKAQAALGSFFVKLAKTRRLRFAIETHSDFLVDRIRQEVAAGTIPNDDVVILFFKKNNGATTVHPIHLDQEGNILDAPDDYREFFLEEELKLLSRGAG